MSETHYVVSDIPEPGPNVPAQIGKYRVRAKLGEGATSEVFLAHDPFRNCDVAIKRVRASLVPDSRESALQRRFFAAEAALVGQLRHPNVVQILDAVDDPLSPYLVMEYVDGVTLRRYCRANSLLAIPQIIEIGFKCAMALGYCFRQGLIHRDVKPANLLVTVQGDQITDVKVTDFGSVFNQGADHTQIFRVGSLAYMSPEQLDGDTLDCRADIYSLAAVMYHLIAGRPPFDAQQQQAIMHQIYHASAPPLSSLREGVPPALQSLIERGLAKERELRPANWDEFAQALSALTTARDAPRANTQEVVDSERFTLLRSLDFFAGFGDIELWEVVRRATWQRHTYGQAIFRKGQEGNSFHIVTQGQLEVYREGRLVASLGTGSSVGELAYLAPNPELRVHAADVLVSQAATTVSMTPEAMEKLSLSTRHLFDKAFIRVLVRRLHAAHEALAHPQRIL
ncbi:serine/threonine-protein kinase [Rubrivivax sp. A210]|uniref:serine/threonine-protein kinase n=1 Tax=Rubrivivax sp. A210 TaxID=2772301 RepID=UPI001918B345|nr:serine/threonine-protein kinase [Rubrivivax sp. A210]